MHEHFQHIGETAGKIYQALSGQGSKSAGEIQREIGLSDASLLNQALGWLAREQKISFNRKGKVLTLTLAE